MPQDGANMATLSLTMDELGIIREACGDMLARLRRTEKRRDFTRDRIDDLKPILDQIHQIEENAAS